ncbi:agmatinase [Klebsiella sp. R390]|uniref:agmatinase n=1 Tax=Klebsiella sp. R390 TaxID=2755400 RepID=UPI003DAA0964
MTFVPEQAYPQPQDGDIPRFSGLPTFFRLPFAPQAADLDIAVVGVPWDGGTTNRAGTRHGPRELRNASSLVRRVHPVSRRSPYDFARVGDLGDVRINPMDVQDSMARIEARYRDLAQQGVMPLTAGGDHLTTLPVLRALGRDKPLGMIHFDAHSDTNDSYFGGERFTHGTPFRRAVEEGVLDPRRTVQIGIRGALFSEDEHCWAEENGITIFRMEQVNELGIDAVMQRAREIVGDRPTYISFDIDVLDPVYAPGTGTPEIGGMTTIQGQRCIRQLAGLNLIGADLVEVSPPFDQGNLTSLTGATLMFELLCQLADAHHRRIAS